MKRSQLVAKNPIFFMIFVVVALYLGLAFGIDRVTSPGSVWRFVSWQCHEGATAIAIMFVAFGISNALGHLLTLNIDHLWVGRTLLGAAVCAFVATLGLMHNGIAMKGVESSEAKVFFVVGLVALFLALVVAPFLHGAIIQTTDDGEDRRAE